MPIELHLIDEERCPVVVCDSCGEAISDASKGMVKYPIGSVLRIKVSSKGSVSGREVPPPDPRFFHKGPRCDRDQQNDAFGWMELATFLERLSVNCRTKLVRTLRMVQP